MSERPRWIRRRWFRRALLSPLLLAHSVIANSRFTQRQILRDCPGVRSRARVIYNGKDWSSYDVAHEAGPEGVYRVLYLGRSATEGNGRRRARESLCFEGWGSTRG